MQYSASANTSHCVLPLFNQADVEIAPVAPLFFIFTAASFSLQPCRARKDGNRRRNPTGVGEMDEVHFSLVIRVIHLLCVCFHLCPLASHSPTCQLFTLPSHSAPLRGVTVQHTKSPVSPVCLSRQCFQHSSILVKLSSHNSLKPPPPVMSRSIPAPRRTRSTRVPDGWTVHCVGVDVDKPWLRFTAYCNSGSGLKKTLNKVANHQAKQWHINAVELNKHFCKNSCCF